MLVLYPTAEWERLAEKIAQMPIASRQARSYGRLLFGGAREVALDKTGRVLLPAFLREYASLEAEALLVGINTYVEIWSPACWSETLARDGENLDDILAEMMPFGV